MLRSFTIALVAALALSGCTLDTIKSAAVVGAHGKLLDEEYEAAALAVADAPELTETERDALWVAIDALDAERDYLRTILERSTGEKVIAAVTACRRIEAIADVYTDGKLTYLAAIEREGGSVPIMLVQYDESARLVYARIYDRACDDGSAIDAADVAGYLGLAFRAIAATQGVPL